MRSLVPIFNHLEAAAAARPVVMLRHADPATFGASRALHTIKRRNWKAKRGRR